MFAVTVAFAIKPGLIEAFLPLMVENARASVDLEPGCRQFDVCRNPDADSVFLYEIYDDKAAFDLHLESAHFKAFDAAVARMVVAKSVQTFQEVLR